MKPAPFEYYDPTTVAEAIGLLTEFGDEAKVLAGGQSLVPMLNFRLARPSRLIDLNHLTELDFLGRENGVLVVGALTRQRSLERAEPADGAWALLQEAVAHVGHAHIRNRGTVGGSIAHADPAAELPAAVTALGALMVSTGPGGSREIGAAEFFEGWFTTALAPDEILTEIRVPEWPVRSGAAFLEVSRRKGDFAQIGVAASVALGDDGQVVRAGIAVSGAGSGPVPATGVADGLLGQAPTTELLTRLTEEFVATLTPPADAHGSADYRRQLVRHLLPRAVDRSVRRALS